MTFLAWDPFKILCDNFIKSVNKRRELFADQKILLEKSIEVCIYFLPQPIDLLTRRVYEDTHDDIQKKIDTVVQFLKTIGNEKIRYERITNTLNKILMDLQDTEFSPLIEERNKETNRKMIKILCSNDEKEIGQLTMELDMLTKRNNTVP
jgi:hypothetical protein